MNFKLKAMVAGVAPGFSMSGMAAEPIKIGVAVGSHGAGKTTTMRAISGMIKPKGGRFTLGGKDMRLTRARPKGDVRHDLEKALELFPRLKERQQLLVEQFAAAALNLADYGCVLENGGISVHGPADSLKNDPAAYLGGGQSH